MILCSRLYVGLVCGWTILLSSPMSMLVASVFITRPASRSPPSTNSPYICFTEDPSPKGDPPVSYPYEQ